MQNKSSVNSATFVLALILVAILGFFSLLFSGIPSPLKAQIAQEHRKIEDAGRTVRNQRAELAQAVPADSELFAASSFDPNWAGRYGQAEAELNQAAALSARLDQLTRANKRRSASEAGRLLHQESHLRQDAQAAVAPLYTSFQQRVELKRRLPETLREIQSAGDVLSHADYSAVEKTVLKAENDWPAKQTSQFDPRRKEECRRLAAVRCRARAEAARQSHRGRLRAGLPHRKSGPARTGRAECERAERSQRAAVYGVGQSSEGSGRAGRPSPQQDRADHNHGSCAQSNRHCRFACRLGEHPRIRLARARAQHRHDRRA